MEEIITAKQLRNLHNKEDYEVWDDVNSLWVSADDCRYLYNGPSGFSSPKNPYAPINAIAVYHEHKKQMICMVVPHPKDPNEWTNKLLEEVCNEILEIPKDEYTTTFLVFKNEHDMLLQFLDEIEDSDMLVGWNSARFDHPYIAARIKRVLGEYHFSRLSFPEGHLPKLEEKEPAREPGNFNQETFMELSTSGRMLGDYMLLYKKYEPAEKPSYKLSTISDDVLVDSNDEPLLPKLDYEGSLFDLYSGSWRPNLNALPDKDRRDTLSEWSIKREYIRQEIERRGLSVN